MNQVQISYNQYVKTFNPIEISSDFLTAIPHEKIEIKEYENPDGTRGLVYGKYEKDEWNKFIKEIELNGIKEFLTLELKKNFYGINEFSIKDGLHRIYAIKFLQIDKKIPVMIEIDTNIPFDELRDIFNMMTQSKIISNRDYAALLNQFVLLQIESVKHGFNELLNEKKLNVSDKFYGNKLFDFIDKLSSSKLKAYIKTEGIDFSWSFKNGKLIYKFENDEEITDISKKYPIYSVEGDGDIIKAAVQAVSQFFEKISPETMRALGIFKGNWIECTIYSTEVENALPYNMSENYIRLNDITTEVGIHIKNGRSLLKEIVSNIGDIYVSSEVVEYDGYDLNSIKYYTKNKTSVWKFVAPNQIDQKKLENHVLSMIEKWKQYPEFKKLRIDKLNVIDATSISHALVDKINNDLSSNLQIKNKNVIEFLDIDDIPMTLSHSTNKQEIDVINIAKILNNKLNSFILRDVLGLTSESIGSDFITRFNSDPKEYLNIKSYKFSKKNANSGEYVNIGSIIEKINIFIQELQRLDFQTNNLSGNENEKAKKTIKGIAYNALRLKSNIYNVKTYDDLMRAIASHYHIFAEGKSPILAKLNII